MPTPEIVDPAHAFSDLLLVGGGHSHVEVLRRFAMAPESGLRLTLLAREVEAPYSGMLPGLIAGHYRFEDAHIDLRRLAMAAGARIVQGEAVGLDLAQRRLLIQGRSPIAFDLLSLDIGSRPSRSGIPGAAEHALSIKPVDRFLASWARIEGMILAETRPVRLAVVGGGAGGVELSLALQHRLRPELAGKGGDPDRVSFVILTDLPEILPGHPDGVRRRFRRVLAERGIAVMTDQRVTRLEAKRLITASGEVIPFDHACWTTTAAPAPWLAASGLATDAGGFVAVDDTLRSLSHPFVFASGDAAAMVNHNLPKAGVYAVRQGPPLAQNLRRAAFSRPLIRYRPQRHFLSLISTGNRYAVGSRGALAWEGAWVWRFKDWIDRRWMAMYQHPERMAAGTMAQAPIAMAGRSTAAAMPAMRCGGCGAKLDGGLLARVLARVAPKGHPDVVVGLAEADDAAVVAVPQGKLLVQSVDFFRAIVDDPFLFARITANHCLGDLYAMGAEPHTALAMATLPVGPESWQERDLEQLLAGALATLGDAGASLIGGHSGEGAELAFGLSVNGLVDRDRLTRKVGLAPDQVLVLTKPLGTGTLFAAAMRGKAKGRWIEAALASMLQSSREAAGVLRRHGAHAVTDVTGFGLAGHLLEMLRASSLDAELSLGAIPALEGALETLDAGIASTMAPSNLKLGVAVEDRTSATNRAATALLYDPQTAGGLIAGIPLESADACLDTLHQAGYAQASVIGRVVARAGDSAAITLVG